MRLIRQSIFHLSGSNKTKIKYSITSNDALENNVNSQLILQSGTITYIQRQKQNSELEKLIEEVENKKHETEEKSKQPSYFDLLVAVSIPAGIALFVFSIAWFLCKDRLINSNKS